MPAPVRGSTFEDEGQILLRSHRRRSTYEERRRGSYVELDTSSERQDQNILGREQQHGAADTDSEDVDSDTSEDLPNGRGGNGNEGHTDVRRHG